VNPQARPSYRKQYAELKTLWTEGQVEVLVAEVLDDLVSEFGPMSEAEDAEQTIQCAVGWQLPARVLESGSRPPGAPLRVFDGPTVRRCLWCGQRMVWESFMADCVCSDACGKRYSKRPIPIRAVPKPVVVPKPVIILKPKPVILPPPPLRYASLDSVIVSIKKQLSDHHDVQAELKLASYVRGWVVLEFAITNRNDQKLHVVLDGAGPGRAAWVLAAVSDEQAVSRVVGLQYASDVGIPQS
jgi:hypothetical protein